MLLIPVLFSLFIVLSSSVVTLFFRWLAAREVLARDKIKEGLLVER
ncbi:MAG: sodium/bile acid cotransporter 2 [bacterium]